MFPIFLYHVSQAECYKNVHVMPLKAECGLHATEMDNLWHAHSRWHILQFLWHIKSLNLILGLDYLSVKY